MWYQPDIWIIQRKTDEGFRIETSNRISFSLPADHVHHFATEMPGRDSDGTLLMTSQARVDDLCGHSSSETPGPMARAGVFSWLILFILDEYCARAVLCGILVGRSRP
jgi:hypothetical protein